MRNDSRWILFCAAIGIAMMILPASALAVSFQVPGTETTLDVGGYVKLDVVHNDVSFADDSMNNYEYAPGAVPIDGTTDGEEGQIVFNGRESRLWVKTATPTDMGILKTHLELDFDTSDGNQIVSNSRHARIRHAYGTLKNFLFGRTWSLFMHLPSMPETNDFGGPTGTQFVRQGQIRYTIPLADKTNLQIGLENPETFIVGPWGAGGATAPSVDDDKYPDVIVRFNTGGSWGLASAAAMVRELRIESGAVDDNTWTFSGQLAGVLKIGAKDQFTTQVSYGVLGRYSSLATHQDGVIDANNEIKELNQLAGFVGYQHWWSSTWRSSLYYGFTEADDPAPLVGSTTTKKTNSVHANLMWNPVPQLRVGIEYIRGYRELYNGDDGTLNRIQFSTRYDF